ncbi:hypothetical protein [Microbispora catharanthi]|uniref:hypothetical protein n=1 Tax=Microbispora catharanthi TaxID=1712871 RepID=UPI001F0E1903|nr:hypothetical protein [Microbispora catharanthi]
MSRRPDDRDRRVSHLTLTDEGRALTDRRRELGDLLGELLLLLEGRLGARQL